MTHYDLIIRNGTLVDGSGGPSSQQDIAVKDGKIACIAPNLDAGADKIVDASNMLVRQVLSMYIPTMTARQPGMST